MQQETICISLFVILTRWVNIVINAYDRGALEWFHRCARTGPVPFQSFGEVHATSSIHKIVIHNPIFQKVLCEMHTVKTGHCLFFMGNPPYFMICRILSHYTI